MISKRTKNPQKAVGVSTAEAQTAEKIRKETEGNSTGNNTRSEANKLLNMLRKI